MLKGKKVIKKLKRVIKKWDNTVNLDLKCCKECTPRDILNDLDDIVDYIKRKMEKKDADYT